MGQNTAAPRSDRRRGVWRLLLLLGLAVGLWVESLPTVREPGTPRQIHLSWELPSPRAVTVVWVTHDATPHPLARYGTTPDLPLKVEAHSAPLPGEPGSYVHRATLGPLADATPYWYRVGSDRNGWSSLYRFVSAPGPGQSCRFAAIADMGIGAKGANNILRISEWGPDFTLHLGDLSYADGKPEDWDTWFDIIEPAASRAPYMTAIGNHEYEKEGGLATYLGRLALPNNERYYSFDCGLVHMVVLESGQRYGPPPAEVTEWLVSDLERNARDGTHPWTVVGFHFPPYSSGPYGGWEGGRTAWSPLFDRYGVALVLSGHTHAYERSWPINAGGQVAAQDYANPVAPVYLVNGGGGAQRRMQSYRAPQPYWSAFRRSEGESIRVVAEKDRLIVTVVRPDGSELDRFALIRTRPAP